MYNNINKAKEILINSKNTILNHLKNEIINRDFNYETFGKEIESCLISKLIEIFKENSIIISDTDYKKADNKNEFPDFTLFTKPTLAIEIKVGNQNKKKGRSWVNCDNSNNDMGTLNKWQEKINQFGGENIYYIFIIYKFNDTSKEIIDVQIEPFYKFIGINKEGLLKYREKDGNLRPKNFFDNPIFNNFDEFYLLLKETDYHRSERIIEKHIEKLPPERRINLLNKLKNKY